MSNKELTRLESESVHLVVTSPPYVTTKFERDQEFDYDGFLAHFREVCEQLYRVLVPGGRFALNIADILTKYRYEEDGTICRVPLGSDTFQIAQATGFRLLERFIWDKGFTRNFGGPILGSYPYPLTLFNQNYFEYIYIIQKPGKRKVTQELREKSKLSLEEWQKWTQQWWRVESISEKFKYHPAIFPVEIPYRLIRMYSYVDDVILDPYLGTGATMIAADATGRTCIGFEIDKQCPELVQKRIEFDILPLINRNPEYDIIEN